MAIQLTIEEIQARLSQILAQAEGGVDVMITRNGTPIARLVPVRQPIRREVGFVPGRVPDSFFESLPVDELKRWE